MQSSKWGCAILGCFTVQSNKLKWEKHKKRGLNCVGFLELFSRVYRLETESEAVMFRVWVKKCLCSGLNINTKIKWERERVSESERERERKREREREREREQAQSNYTGSSHKQIVVQSPCISKGFSL